MQKYLYFFFFLERLKLKNLLPHVHRNFIFAYNIYIENLKGKSQRKVRGLCYVSSADIPLFTHFLPHQSLSLTCQLIKKKKFISTIFF